MSLVVLTYPLTDDTIAEGSEVTKNLTDITDQVNGSLNSANIAASGVNALSIATSAVLPRALDATVHPPVVESSGNSAGTTVTASSFVAVAGTSATLFISETMDVMIIFTAKDSSGNASLGLAGTSGTALGFLQVLDSATEVVTHFLKTVGPTTTVSEWGMPLGSLNTYLVGVTSGSHTYSVQMRCQFENNMQVSMDNFKLIAKAVR